MPNYIEKRHDGTAAFTLQVVGRAFFLACLRITSVPPCNHRPRAGGRRSAALSRTTTSPANDTRKKVLGIRPSRIRFRTTTPAPGGHSGREVQATDEVSPGTVESWTNHCRSEPALVKTLCTATGGARRPGPPSTPSSPEIKHEYPGFA